MNHVTHHPRTAARHAAAPRSPERTGVPRASGTHAGSPIALLIGTTLATALMVACSRDDAIEVPPAPVPLEQPHRGDAPGEASITERRPRPLAELSSAESEAADTSRAPALAKSRRQEHATAGDVARTRIVYGPAAEPMILPVPMPSDLPAPTPANRERYAELDDNATIRTADESVSTFSIDVDTGAYANIRRFLVNGRLPPADAVRLEEMINYFDYDYPVPGDPEVPFTATTEMGPTPWNADTHLLRVGLKAYEPAPGARPAANLVFLVDVSGSMNAPDKLGLLKTSLNLLAGELTGEDSVGIVVYAGASGVVLEPVAGNDTRAIARALDALAAGGSTNGEAGIETAYRLADEHFVEGGANRVILATDGDFNVGTSGVDALVELIGKRRESGIALTTLGFGTGNYNDHLMEQLADAGDGAYAYIDTLNEARKVLVEELGSTLLTVARDVKIQLEFNPATVAEYRLLGYTNRVLANEDFTDDRVDAGEIGAGHAVTALYEIALHGEGGARHVTSRYAADTPADTTGGEIAELRLRYKRPDEDGSRAFETLVMRSAARDSLEAASDDFRFAAAVAALGQHLRGDSRAASFSPAEAARLAAGAKGTDRFGYRGDFVRLAELAGSLSALDDPLTRRRHDDDG